MATQRTKAGAPSLVNVASISLRGGTDQEGPMTDITYQTTTIGIADQSALLSRIAAWAPISSKVFAKVRKLLRATTH